VWPSVRPLWLTQYELYGVLLMTLSPARLGPHTVWPSVRPLWLTQYELYGVLLMTLSPARSQRTPHCVAERQASLVNPI